MNNPAIRFVAAGLLILGPALLPGPAAGAANMPAPTAQAVRAYSDLPEAIRRQILAGSPRSSADIPDSPFATHTTVLAEGLRSNMVDKVVDLMSKAGYKWVVDYVSVGGFGNKTTAELAQKWSKAPPHYHHYLSALRAKGINVLLRIDPLPWPEGGQITSSNAPTEDTLAKGELYVRSIVRNLKPYTRHWQIWNEPNLGNSRPCVEPEIYAAVAARLSRAIKAEQPDAVVYGPATAMLQCMADKPYPWVDRALQAGLLKSVDVFTYHPYRQGYDRLNIPEHASEFHPWTRWGSYTNQIADLRGRLRKAAGRDIPLATSEDGHPTLVTARGEQPITWVVGAKYELRKALLDFWLGVYPRTHFCFYRGIPNAFFESEASFNMMTDTFEVKPIYYAAQNLNAVLDSTYRRVDNVPVSIQTRDGKPLGELGLQLQVYAKRHPAFDELLVFFWSSEPSEDMHIRHPAQMEIPGAGWEAPLQIDLMSMPDPRAQSGMIDLVNPEYVSRRIATLLAGRKTAQGLLIEPMEVRDYPLLIKVVRLHP